LKQPSNILKIGTIVKPVGNPPNALNKAQQLKQQLQDEREQQRKKRMLAREKFEKDNSGAYELIYPLVSYQEEFDILSGNLAPPVSSLNNQ
jgi:hypothetical protein